MNYTTLLASVGEYLETDESVFSSYIDQFIQLAEEDIYRRVPALSTRLTATAATTASNRFLSTPDDFLSVHSLELLSGTTYTTLIRKDPSYMREAYPSSSTTGTPKYYSMHDHDSIVMAPTPNAAFTVEMQYYGKPESIVTASTTWLGDNAENALMWGTVLQGYIFLKGNAELMAVYKKSYDDSISNLQMLVDGLQKKDEYRHGSRRIPA